MAHERKCKSEFDTSSLVLKDVEARKKKEIQLLLEAKDKYKALLVSRPNVIGLGVGKRTRGGKVVDELVVKVYVSRKVPVDQLAKAHSIPRTLDIKDKKVPVDVEEAKIPVAQLFTLQSRPLVGGSSIGPTTAGFRFTGTLGVCVTLDDSRTYILSNNHVLSAVDQLARGERIVQPSIPTVARYLHRGATLWRS